MLRIARLDTPGFLHHVMIRGIERRKIFNDDKETLGTHLTNWTILLQYFYGLMPLQQLMRKHPSDARSLPAGITASAVSQSIRRFRVKIERDRRLLKKIEKTGERLKSSTVKIRPY